MKKIGSLPDIDGLRAIAVLSVVLFHLKVPGFYAGSGKDAGCFARCTQATDPPIYQPEEYQPARDMGFEQIIWTLYRFPGDRKSVLTQLEKMEGAIAVTMPLRRAESSLPKKLAGLQIPTYVHSINDIEQAQKLVNELLVSEIYTDFLPPQ